MTNNLINIILATCLLFSSLNLVAEQTSAATNKAEAQFLVGTACLKQSNNACALAALAKIPSHSPYAKLLQGEVAYQNRALDQALQLLLPLQSETLFSTDAKVSLHQSLAKAFAQLQDPEQSLVHLLQVDTALSKTKEASQPSAIAQNQAHIWELLNKLNQNELLTIRGNNTDDHFQGWIDLALTAKHQDLNSSLRTWQISYPDHPALAFSNTLQRQHPQQTLTLASTDEITIIYQARSDTDDTKAEAFRLGLQTALSNHGLSNAVHMIASTNDETYSVNDATSAEEPALSATDMAAQLQSAYRITLQLDPYSDETDSIKAGAQPALTLGFHLNDEAKRIVKFASDNAISRVAIVTTEDERSAALLKHFNSAWQAAFNLNEDHNSLNVITLPPHIAGNDPNLLDIQTKISAQAHDMVLLATSAADARVIKPYLNVGTPTVAFSNLHEVSPDYTLNTVRFVDIPFLLSSSAAHAQAKTQLNSNDLLRWYALGTDALSILIAAQSGNDKEVILNGLTGVINMEQGTISHQPLMARFTYEGIIKEQ